MQSDKYAHFIRPHPRVLRQLLLDLEFYIADIGSVSVFSIESRVKELGSALEKSRRLGIPIEDLQDIAGIRIVVATRLDVDVVKRFFYRRADISKDLEIVKESDVSRPTGYRSTHLITKFSGHYSRSAQSGNLEVQIPTIFEHAFNFVSHSWVYKSSTVHDPNWKEQFRALSEQLAAIDEAVASLHRNACDESRFDPEREPLSPLIFRRVVQEEFHETVSVADAVDYVQSYADMGVQTVGQLQRFFRNPEVQELWSSFAEVERTSGKRPFLSGPKVTFWHSFGTRLEFARQYLEKLKSGGS